MPLTKLSLSNGKYYIRSEAPWKGYLQGKLCSISEKATKPRLSALFDVTSINGSSGLVSLRSSFFDGSYLVVQKKDNGTMLTEEEHFSGRLFLSNKNNSSKLEAAQAQFELFVPPNADNAVKKDDGIRAIIRSDSNQRFLSIKSGGNPFATEKDPALATVFILERFLLTIFFY